MGETPLSRERVLAAAEEVLRRHGVGKANVVDVAQVLGVSHASVYRHFPSKAALRGAVLQGWLARVSEPLREIAAAPAPAPERLRAWLIALRRAKRAKVRDDPELFAAYAALAAEAREVIAGHVEELLGQLAGLIAEGIRRGELGGKRAQARDLALAIFDATSRFHHPAMAYLWDRPGEDAAFEQLLGLLLAGLAPRASHRKH